MKQAIIKKILAIIMAFSLVAPILASAPIARATADSLLWGGQKSAIKTNTGLGEKDPRALAADVIKILLGFLGLIAVVIVLVGGFKWMTSQGSEDKIEEARGMIISGFVGLLIILAAFGLATFVIDQIYTTTGATG